MSDGGAPFPDAAGLVLAGGRSRRMGHPKSELALGGETLQASRVRVLGQVARLVWLSVPFGAAPGPGRLVDGTPSPGPLAAICAGLEQLEPAGCEWLLVLAVDMPNVPASLLALLYEHRLLGGAAVPRHPATGRLDPLVSCWHRQARRQVAACLAAGDRSVRAALQVIPTRIVTLPASQADWLVNVNTPDDWEAWRRDAQRDPALDAGGGGV